MKEVSVALNASMKVRMTNMFCKSSVLAFLVMLSCSAEDNKTEHVLLQDSPIWVAAVSSEGVLIPFAMYHQEDWSNPWTLPFVDEAPYDTVPDQPTLDMPNEWYLYSRHEQHTKIHLKELVRTEVHCSENWAFTTDWKEGEEGESSGWRFAGIAFSRRKEVLSEVYLAAKQEEIDQIRRDLDLMGNDERGELYHRYESLGYYRLQSKTIIVLRSIGYESEWYIIVEVQGKTGKLVIEVPGAGC